MGIFSFILSPILAIFATNVVANFLPCSPIIYMEKTLSCNPPVLSTLFGLIIIPLLVGSLSIYLGVRRKSS